MTIAGEDDPREEAPQRRADVISSSEPDKRLAKSSEIDTVQPLGRDYR
jgi:hypothetical protein